MSSKKRCPPENPVNVQPARTPTVSMSFLVMMTMIMRITIMAMVLLMMVMQTSYLSLISRIISVEKILSCGELSDFCKEFEQFMALAKAWAGSWGQDTVWWVHFKVFATSHFAHLTRISLCSSCDSLKNFVVTNGGSQLTFLTQLEKVIIFRSIHFS